jgi:hypothetical protein
MSMNGQLDGSGFLIPGEDADGGTKVGLYGEAVGDGALSYPIEVKMRVLVPEGGGGWDLFGYFGGGGMHVTWGDVKFILTLDATYGGNHHVLQAGAGGGYLPYFTSDPGATPEITLDPDGFVHLTVVLDNYSISVNDGVNTTTWAHDVYLGTASSVRVEMVAMNMEKMDYAQVKLGSASGASAFWTNFVNSVEEP